LCHTVRRGIEFNLQPDLALNNKLVPHCT